MRVYHHILRVYFVWREESQCTYLCGLALCEVLEVVDAGLLVLLVPLQKVHQIVADLRGPSGGVPVVSSRTMRTYLHVQPHRHHQQISIHNFKHTLTVGRSLQPVVTVAGSVRERGVVLYDSSGS